MEANERKYVPSVCLLSYPSPEANALTSPAGGEVNMDIAAAMTFLDSRDWHILWGVPPKNDNRGRWGEIVNC